MQIILLWFCKLNQIGQHVLLIQVKSLISVFLTNMVTIYYHTLLGQTFFLAGLAFVYKAQRLNTYFYLLYPWTAWGCNLFDWPCCIYNITMYDLVTNYYKYFLQSICWEFVSPVGYFYLHLYALFLFFLCAYSLITECLPGELMLWELYSHLSQ